MDNILLEDCLMACRVEMGCKAVHYDKILLKCYLFYVNSADVDTLTTGAHLYELLCGELSDLHGDPIKMHVTGIDVCVLQKNKTMNWFSVVHTPET
jgi:hypothetical protein